MIDFYLTQAILLLVVTNLILIGFNIARVQDHAQAHDHGKLNASKRPMLSDGYKKVHSEECWRAHHDFRTKPLPMPTDCACPLYPVQETVFVEADPELKRT